MPRSPKAIDIRTIDTTAEPSDVKVLPGPKHHAQVFGLATPDEVACANCGAFSPSSEIKCAHCGVRWDAQDQTHRQNVARRQEIAVGEEKQRQQVVKSREVDPNLASSVADALALVVRDAQQIRDGAAAEVEASKGRLEKAQAALWANDCTDTRDDFQRAQLQAMAAPGNLALADAALNQLGALQPMAKACDDQRAAGMSAEAFRADLATRMQRARKHLDEAMREFVAAYEMQVSHQAGAKAAIAMRTKLDGKLIAIRRSFSLRPKLVHGLDHIHSWADVSHAVAKAIIDALQNAAFSPGIVDDLRSRVRSQQ